MFRSLSILRGARAGTNNQSGGQSFGFRLLAAQQLLHDFHGGGAQAQFGPKVFTDDNLAKVEALIQFAESSGHTLLELAMSWLACRPW